jgi:Arc/MetJ-type ribon-helix-helix transcriptional regulator
MKYANVSVKFPRELDAEIERFLDETGIYTNKSEFIKEACRRHLQTLHDDASIAALRTEQLLARAEQQPIGDDELRARLDTLGAELDPDEVAAAVESAREETSDRLQE